MDANQSELSVLPAGMQSEGFFAPGADPNAAPVIAKNWRDHLRTELRQLSTGITHIIATEKKQQALEHTLKCTGCGSFVSELQVVTLRCSLISRDASADNEAKHVFCRGCMSDAIKYQNIVRRPVFEANRARYEDLEQRLYVRLRLQEHESRPSVNTPFLLLCPECRTPNVIVRESRFQCGLDRDVRARSLTDEFVVHLDATRVLADNFWREFVWENERRPPFGVYSKENLLVVDFHGRFCLPNGAALDCVSSLPELNECDDVPLPNSKWYWLESFSPSANMMETENGWRYLFNFRYPVKDPTREGQGRPEMTTFVRQRELIRTRIRFSEPVCKKLNELFGGEGE